MLHRTVILFCIASFAAGVGMTWIAMTEAPVSNSPSSGVAEGTNAGPAAAAGKATQADRSNHDRSESGSRFVIARGQQIPAIECDIWEIASLERLGHEGDGNASRKLASIHTYSTRDAVAAYYWAVKAYQQGHPSADLKLIENCDANARTYALDNEALSEVPPTAKATQKLMMQMMVSPAIFPAETLEERIGRILDLARKQGISAAQFEIDWATDEKTKGMREHALEEMPHKEVSLWTLLGDSVGAAELNFKLDVGKATIFRSESSSENSSSELPPLPDE